ncbi:hypothetical protein DFR87_03375 [Metallosphaera hakonensis JCM 8857 = DSM 7519]|uniref:DedA family protein n=1 Tax=Metallosphaera hakonensis JCM 8857 = DSM 7519 TaxID=1293036 RepID=A0A2U9IWY5_9CREN|nr:hypothetical protein DFR87_03375 [Metallosphaera hakonensis JCM 8857 = DSM 7519]
MGYYYLALVFAISFVSNATPFFGAPYTVIASTILLKIGFSPSNFALIVFASGLGAALAKSVMYGIGYGVGSNLKNNKNVVFFHRLIKGRSFYVALFIAAVIPFFPFDDFIFLIGGAGNAPLLKMVEVTVVSKLIKSSVEIGIEAAGIIQIGKLTGISPVTLGVVSSIVFGVLGVLLFKIDWEKLYAKVERYFRQHSSSTP